MNRKTLLGIVLLLTVVLLAYTTWKNSEYKTEVESLDQKVEELTAEKVDLLSTNDELQNKINELSIEEDMSEDESGSQFEYDLFTEIELVLISEHSMLDNIYLNIETLENEIDSKELSEDQKKAADNEISRLKALWVEKKAEIDAIMTENGLMSEDE